MADNYTVTGQRQTTVLKPNGTFQDVVEVSFETIPSGAYGTIQVPVSAYTVENVSAELARRAAAMEAVHTS